MKKVFKTALLGMGVSMLFMIAYLVYLSPQKTPPFLDEKGKVIANSIAEIKTISVNGYQQRLLIRGKDKNNPILLHVHGGPGGPDYPFLEDSNVEDIFTVCYWEQRGAGASFSDNIPAKSMNLHHIVEDGITVTRFLLEHFGKEKIYLQGHSWGTAVGTNMAQRQPDLYHAYIGIGQMANSQLSEIESYDFALSSAEKIGDKEGIMQLEQIGRPPYQSDAQWLKSVMPERMVMRKYETQALKNKKQKSIVDIYWAYISYKGYSIKDKLNMLKGDAFSMQNLWKVAIKVNLFKQVPVLEIPVYMIQGKYDKHTVTSVAKTYFDSLKAPTKQYFEFENSAHDPHIDEFDRYKIIMQSKVLKIE